MLWYALSRNMWMCRSIIAILYLIGHFSLPHLAEVSPPRSVHIKAYRKHIFVLSILLRGGVVGHWINLCWLHLVFLLRVIIHGSLSGPIYVSIKKEKVIQLFSLSPAVDPLCTMTRRPCTPTRVRDRLLSCVNSCLNPADEILVFSRRFILWTKCMISGVKSEVSHVDLKAGFGLIFCSVCACVLYRQRENGAVGWAALTKLISYLERHLHIKEGWIWTGIHYSSCVCVSVRVLNPPVDKWLGAKFRSAY